MSEEEWLQENYWRQIRSFPNLPKGEQSRRRNRHLQR